MRVHASFSFHDAAPSRFAVAGGDVGLIIGVDNIFAGKWAMRCLSAGADIDEDQTLSSPSINTSIEEVDQA